MGEGEEQRDAIQTPQETIFIRKWGEGMRREATSRGHF